MFTYAIVVTVIALILFAIAAWLEIGWKNAEADCRAIKQDAANRVKWAEERCETLKRHLNRAIKDHADLTREKLNETKLVGIGFHALLPDGQIKESKWRLGVGPCGKDVTKLLLLDSTQHKEYKVGRAVISPALIAEPPSITVVQVTSDGEVKHFKYRKEDVVGRVVTTYAE